jgi:hypothetical protein
METNFDKFRTLIEENFVDRSINGVSNVLYDFKLKNKEKEILVEVKGIPFSVPVGSQLEYISEKFSVEKVSNSKDKLSTFNKKTFNYHLSDDGGCSTEWEVPVMLFPGTILKHEFGKYKVEENIETGDVLCERL